jgi:SAM-dependent methyltransferase
LTVTFSLADLDFLASDTGTRWLERLAVEDLSDSQTLHVLTVLRHELMPQQAGAALEMARLRQKAVEKFGSAAAQLFFISDALEQASDPLVRRYRAQSVQGTRVVDACCGIGSDALAFAQSGNDVLGLDIDPLRITIARYNAAVLGITVLFEVADVRDGLPECDYIFYDPARRDEQGHRIHDVERYIPPLSLVKGWQAERITVKLSPGVDLAQLAPYTGHVEFVSVSGDLKEALLHLGGASFVGQTSATLLTATAAYHWQPLPGPVTAPVGTPRIWLVEPDPALLRAGLVQAAAVAFGGALLDETIAYFTTAALPDSGWARAWRILDWMPFHLKRLRAYLREHHVGHVTVKKRGSAITPEELIPKLKLKGSESRTLVLTRCQGQPIVLICQDK